MFLVKLCIVKYLLETVVCNVSNTTLFANRHTESSKPPIALSTISTVNTSTLLKGFTNSTPIANSTPTTNSTPTAKTTPTAYSTLTVNGTLTVNETTGWGSGLDDTTTWWCGFGVFLLKGAIIVGTFFLVAGYFWCCYKAYRKIEGGKEKTIMPETMRRNPQEPQFTTLTNWPWPILAPQLLTRFAVETARKSENNKRETTHSKKSGMKFLDSATARVFTAVKHTWGKVVGKNDKNFFA